MQGEAGAGQRFTAIYILAKLGSQLVLSGVPTPAVMARTQKVNAGAADKNGGFTGEARPQRKRGLIENLNFLAQQSSLGEFFDGDRGFLPDPTVDVGLDAATAARFYLVDPAVPDRDG